MAQILGLAKTVPQVPAATGVQKRGDDPKRVADAAQQFESLLIAQLLKSMRESGTGGWLGTGDDQAGAQAVELAEGQMAQALAQQGGLGIAHLVVNGLQHESRAPKKAAHLPAQKLQP